MGTPAPIDNIGEPCSYCWGVGGTHGPLPTPKFIQVTFAGLSKGIYWNTGDPEPPDGTYTIEQYTSGACVFSKTYTNGLRFTFQMYGHATQFVVRYGGMTAWESIVVSPCVLYLPFTAGREYAGGSVTVSFF